MTRRDDLLHALSDLDAIEEHFNNRVEIWRVIVDEKGHELFRICRGSFFRQPQQKETSS